MTIDPRWQDLAGTLAAAQYAEVRSEAGEILAAEAARSRLEERRGLAVLTLVDGRRVYGVIGASQVCGWLTVTPPGEAALLVLAGAISTIEGSAVALRDESGGSVPDARTLGAFLRDAQDELARVRLTLVGGRVVSGLVAFVGADHVELRAADRPALVVAWTAVTTVQRLG